LRAAQRLLSCQLFATLIVATFVTNNSKPNACDYECTSLSWASNVH
jgi:hypothetical protein